MSSEMPPENVDETWPEIPSGGPPESASAAPAPTAKKRRRRRWPIVALVVIGVPVAVLAWVWFGGRPRLPEGPLRFARGEDGQLHPESEPASPGGLFLEVEAGKIEASNQLSTASSASRSGNARFACRHVAVFNRSEDLLMQRVGASIVEHLRKLPFVDRLEYFPDGLDPDQGRCRPDVIVFLDRCEMEESGLLSLTLETRIRMTAGTEIARSRCSYFDHLTPPILRFSWQADLEHRSTTTGVRSAAARYKLPAENIAQQLGESLAKQMQQWYEKDGPLPELPDEFYPAYRPPPEMPFLKAYDAERLISYHGLMNPNETFWRFTTDKPLATVLPEIQTEMESAGWRTERITTDENALPHLRMEKGSDVFEVFPSENERFGTTMVVRSDDEEPAPRDCYVRYLDRIDGDELAAAVERTLVEDADTDVVLLFQSFWNKQQRRKALELLQSRPAQTPRAWLALAELYKQFDEETKARRAVQGAAMLLRTLGEQGDLSNRLKRVAKDLGDEELAKTEPEPELLREMGFVEIKPTAEPVTRETALEEPIHFFGRDDNGELTTISLRVVRTTQAGGKPAYKIAQVISRRSSRSWGTSNEVGEQRPAQHYVHAGTSMSFHVEVSKLPDEQRFRWTWEFPEVEQATD